MTKEGRKIFGYFVAFFGVILLVNIIMVFLAVKTQPELQTENAYEKGLKYNQAADISLKEKQLGYKGNIKIKSLSGNRIELIFNYKNKNSEKITKAEVSAIIYRNSADAEDINLKLKEINGGGYQAEVALPKSGSWQIQITANDGKFTYITSKTFFLNDKNL